MAIKIEQLLSFSITRIKSEVFVYVDVSHVVYYSYPVKNKKRILPFLCADKEKYEVS